MSVTATSAGLSVNPTITKYLESLTKQKKANRRHPNSEFPNVNWRDNEQNYAVSAGKWSRTPCCSVAQYGTKVTAFKHAPLPPSALPPASPSTAIDHQKCYRQSSPPAKWNRSPIENKGAKRSN